MSPIYQYRCEQCGEEEEIYHHHSMLGLFTCNKCGIKMNVVPAAANFTIEGFKSHKGDRKNYE